MLVRFVMIFIHIMFVFFALFSSAKDVSNVFSSKDYCSDFRLNFTNSIAKNIIPNNWEQASNYLFKALPKIAKRDFIENEGSFRNCAPNFIIGKIGMQLKEEWNLSSRATNLVEQMDKMGFWTTDEKVRLIVAGAWMTHIGERFDENIPKRQKFLQEQDEKAPSMVDMPCELLAEKRLIMSDAVLAGYGRFLRWGECRNGKVINYLWERGWFEPTEKELILFCEEPLGDQENFCTKM